MALLRLVLLLLAGTMTLNAGPVWAVDQDALHARLVPFIQDRVHAEHPEAEVRIQLPTLHPAVVDKDCAPFALEASQRSTYGRLPVRVACAGKQPWSFYVTAEVSAEVPAVALTHLVSRGDLITADLLHTVTVDLTRNPVDLLFDPAQVLGKSARRTLQPGVPLRTRDLSTPRAVSKGDQVLIVAQAGHTTISTTGIALQDGHIGDQIRVKNARSERVVRPWVWDKGTVGTRPRTLAPDSKFRK